MWNLVVLNSTTDVLTWGKTTAPLHLGFSNSFNVVVLKFQQKLSERKQKLCGLSFVCLLRSSESLRQVNWFVGIYLGLSAHEKYFSLRTSFMCLQLFFFFCLFHQRSSHSAVCPASSAFVRNESPPPWPRHPTQALSDLFENMIYEHFPSPDLNQVKIFHWEFHISRVNHPEACGGLQSRGWSPYVD